MLRILATHFVALTDRFYILIMKKKLNNIRYLSNLETDGFSPMPNANEISFISLLKAESKKQKAFFGTSNRFEDNTSQVKHTIGCKALALPKG